MLSQGSQQHMDAWHPEGLEGQMVLAREAAATQKSTLTTAVGKIKR
jgi:hypothetical protein